MHEEDYYTIKISSLPQILPAEVRFEIASKNDPLAVEWDFGDLTQAKGKKVVHYYKTPGLKTVLAKVTSKKNQTFLLRQQLNIGEESEQTVSLAIKPLELNAQQKKARIQPEIQGKFESFEWSNTATQQKGKLTSLAAFDIPLVEGKINTLYLKGYAQGKMLALASIDILEEKGNFFTMSLETRPLLKLLGKDVTMSLKLHQLSLANIEHIKWDFGDGENALDRKLLQQHHYDKAGLKLISQKILLKNGKELLIRTSVSIQDPERLGNQAFTSLLGGENLSLQPLGFDHPHTFSTRINGQPFPHASEDAFQPLNLKAWQGLLRIEQTLSPAKGLLLSNQSFFLRPRKGLQSGGQLANPDQLFAGLKCDADQDGIPDLYDDDLDGDGVKNLLGLIRYERADCKLIPGENVDEQRYTQHFGVCSLDNCPLVSNADQSDLNANGKGDSCEKEEEQPKSECGNGKIDSGETCKTCPQDFGPCPDKQEPFCGNGKKEEGEDCKTCPQDIGSCSDEQKPFCGNGKKEAGEDCKTCPQDIGPCKQEEKKLCGNGKVDEEETCKTCPEDLGPCTAFCGNGKMEAAEDCKNCPKDVPHCLHTCGNGKLDSGEQCDDGSENGKNKKCSIACKPIKPKDPLCGNGQIDLGETCLTCPEDLKERCITIGEKSECGNGKIDLGETCTNCPQDVPNCDQDEDGCPDFSDPCPHLPGIGTCCPEIPHFCEGGNCPLVQPICNQCPCQFADYSNTLQSKDQVRAKLRDAGLKVDYSFSPFVPLAPFLERE